MLLFFNFPTWLSTEIIPGLPFRWYGLMYLVSFAVAFLLFNRQVKERKLEVDSDTVLSFFFWGIIGLLIGARVFATLLFDSSGIYLQKPWLIFWPFYQGRFTGLQGMNYYGGLVGAIVCFVWYGKKQKLDLLEWGDMLTAAVPLGYTAGRIGNFINGELFGRVTTWRIGVVFPHARTFPASEPWVQEIAAKIGMEIAPGQTMVNLPRHPSQLYEGFFEGVILWILMWFVFRKRRPYKGYLIGCYIIGYGVFRFFIDYFRIPLSNRDFAIRLSSLPNPPYLLETAWNFIPSQIYSLGMVIGGFLWLYIASRMAQKRTIEAAAEDTAKKKSHNKRKLRKKLK
jgi:phosphatidylglycerol---prolipoprotein diacylglyceryl transferase